MFSDPDWPLEVEFGCFAAVGGPPGSAWAHEMLLRVDIGAARGRCAKNLQVYVVISDTDLYRLKNLLFHVPGFVPPSMLKCKMLVPCEQRLPALFSISMSCCRVTGGASVTTMRMT